MIVLRHLEFWVGAADPPFELGGFHPPFDGLEPASRFAAT